MHHTLILLATTPAPSPSPSLRPGLDVNQITPGFLGFLMTAFFVLATALLIVDMVRRIRRVRYRGQIEEQRLADADAAREQEGAAGVEPSADGWSTTAERDPGSR